MKFLVIYISKTSSSYINLFQKHVIKEMYWNKVYINVFSIQAF